MLIKRAPESAKVTHPAVARFNLGSSAAHYPTSKQDGKKPQQLATQISQFMKDVKELNPVKGRGDI